MSRVLGFVGRVSVRFRWLVLALWVLLTVLSVHFLPSLSSVVDTQNQAFLPSNQPSVQAAHLEEPFQSTTAAQAILVASNADGRPLSSADQAAVTAAEHTLDGVAHVISPVRDLATSKSGQARIASVEANVPAAGGAADNEVDLLRKTLAQPSFGGVPVPHGLTFALTGPLAINADNAKANQAAQARTEVLTYLIILIILLLVYRSALAWLINLLPAAIVLALSQPLIAELAKHGLPVSGVTPIIMTVLVLGAGTDYGLFLIMRFREALQGGYEPRQAVVRALTGVGESITFAGLTVAGALFCLLFSSFGIYQGLGPSLAIAILVMLLASLTLTPALLAIFGRRTFWPSKVVAGGHKEGLWARVAERCAERPGLTLASGVTVLVVLVAGLAGFHTVGFSGGNTSPAGSESARGTAVLEANFPSSVLNPTDLLLVFPTSIWTSPDGLSTVQTAEQLIAGSPLVRQVSGPLRPLGSPLSTEQLQMLYAELGPPNHLPVTPPASVPPSESGLYGLYRSVGQYVSPDGRTVQFTLTLPSGDPTSDAAVASVPGLRHLAAQVAHQVGAERNGIYGIAAFSCDVQRVANHDLLEVFPIVALVIGVLLAVLLRSLVAPIFLLLSVALSYFATLGLTNLFFVHLGGQPGMNFIVPFLLFVFLVALGEDYNILVMSRIREETLARGTTGHRLREAVVNAVAATGSTVTSAGIILAGTFGAFAVAGGSSQLAEIGTALALGILLDTFVVRTLLVPSTVQLLGRWTWWPSRLSRRPAAVGAPGPEAALPVSH